MDQDLIRVLEKISNALEESTATLNRIADHYDGVVPVMTRNANRVEKAHEELEDNRSDLDKSWGIGLSNIMKPQEN
jgi:methylphosphotriester-DNA--protein-cysteine methyltransferase|tara:strand:+ start:585 stop:812 length:228 start_codon:yes stop_codon:yes gene_type:complete